MSQHTRLLIDSLITVNRAADLLQQEGITSIVKNNVESARLAGFGTSNNDVELWVEEENLSKAQSLLKELIK